MLGPPDHDLVLKTEFLRSLPIVTDVGETSRVPVQLHNNKCTLIRISQSDGKQIGLKDRLFGAMGTTRIPFTPFCKMGPPAERE